MEGDEAAKQTPQIKIEAFIQDSKERTFDHAMRQGTILREDQPVVKEVFSTEGVARLGDEKVKLAAGRLVQGKGLDQIFEGITPDGETIRWDLAQHPKKVFDYRPDSLTSQDK